MKVIRDDRTQILNRFKEAVRQHPSSCPTCADLRFQIRKSRMDKTDIFSLCQILLDIARHGCEMTVEMCARVAVWVCFSVYLRAFVNPLRRTASGVHTCFKLLGRCYTQDGRLPPERPVEITSRKVSLPPSLLEYVFLTFFSESTKVSLQTTGSFTQPIRPRNR